MMNFVKRLFGFDGEQTQTTTSRKPSKQQLLFEQGLRYCSKCDTIKEVGEFHKDASRPQGINNQCKSCKRAYYEANSEKLKSRTLQWQRDNKERLNEYQKNYRLRSK